MTRKCPHREVGPEKSKNRQGGPYSLLLARQSSQPRPGPGISGPGCPRVVQGVQGWSKVVLRWSSGCQGGPRGVQDEVRRVQIEGPGGYPIEGPGD